MLFKICDVGAASRLEKIALHLDEGSIRVKHTSSRGFTCVTGKYKGVEVSIVSIGMGIPMMDFFVRETVAVVDGPLAIIRFGTCGGLSELSLAGRVVVASKGSAMIQRNPDSFSAWYEDGGDTPSNMDYSNAYLLSKVCSYL